MSDGSATRGLRERLTSGTEDRLGKALVDLFDNPLLSGALGRAADAREKATQAQELAMGALNLPSAADVERLTRRLRSVSQRLEGIEDGVHRIGRSLASQSIDARLNAIEEQLKGLSRSLSQLHGGASERRGAAPAAAPPASPGSESSTAPRPKAATSRRKPASAKRTASGARTGSARGGGTRPTRGGSNASKG